MRKMRECPKYYACSSPLCPLDEQWRERGAQPGEPICFYLNEHVKDGAEERFRGMSAPDMYAACTQMTSDPALPRWVTAALARAATSGSRWESGQRLLAMQQAKREAA